MGRGGQGGKYPFTLLSEPISPSSLLFCAIFSLLPKRLRFFFSLLPTFFGPFLSPPYSVPPPSKVTPKYFTPDFLRMSTVKLTPSEPKSFKWLLASVTTSNPAKLRRSKESCVKRWIWLCDVATPRKMRGRVVRASDLAIQQSWVWVSLCHSVHCSDFFHCSPLLRFGGHACTMPTGLPPASWDS